MDHFSRVISTILLVKLVKKKKVKQTVLFISTSTAVVPNVFFFCLPYLKVRAKFHGSRSEAGIVHRACLLAVETMPGSFMSIGNLENRNSNWDQLRSFRTRSSSDRSKGFPPPWNQPVRSQPDSDDRILQKTSDDPSSGDHDWAHSRRFRSCFATCASSCSSTVRLWLMEMGSLCLQ